MSFQLYCRYNKREGDRQNGTDSKLVCSAPPGPPRKGLRGQGTVGTDHCTVHHQPAHGILRYERKWRKRSYDEWKNPNPRLPDRRGPLQPDQGPPGAGNPADRQEADPAGVRAEPDRGSADRG